MFAQVRSAQEHAAGGLGIGLALAKGIVELHGGRIEAASAGIGKGSRSPCACRAHRSAAARDVPPAPTRNGQRRAQQAHPARRRQSRRRREPRDHPAARRARGGARARRPRRRCAAFASDGPTSRCSTSACPRPTATRSRAQIRAAPDGSGVLLIAITGWAQDADKAQSRAAGFDHHLTKPIEPETLIGLLGA